MDTVQKQDAHVTVAAPAATLNLWQRLNAIKMAIPYLKKDKEVSGGGSYMAVTHDAVTAATRHLFVEHGVLVMPSEVSSATVDSGMVTGKQNPIIRFEAKYSISFINVDVPTETMQIEVTAHALDQGDKAPGKALSYATKSAILKALQIETGVDDEGREQTKPKGNKDVLEAPITPTTGVWDALTDKQRSRLTDLAVITREALAAGDPAEAVRIIDDAGLDADEKVAIWSRFDSKQRSAMKRAAADVALQP